MGSAVFCLTLRPGLERFREEFEREGVEAFAYMVDVYLGLTGIKVNTIRAFAFLRRELEDIGIVINTSKTVALPEKSHAPTAEDISILKSVDVRVAYKGGVTVVGVPTGNDEYVLERAREIVKEGGTDHLASCLANMPDKQAAAHIVTESPGQRTGYLERALDTELYLKACREADNGAQWAYEKILELTGAAEAQSFFQEGCPDDRLTLQPHQQAQARLSSGESGCLWRKRGERLPLLGARWGSYRRFWQTSLAR